jgi:hypothetical protein
MTLPAIGGPRARAAVAAFRAAMNLVDAQAGGDIGGRHAISQRARRGKKTKDANPAYRRTMGVNPAMITQD